MERRIVPSREAAALFATLLRRGQQLADAENKKFAIVRDDAEVYKLVAFRELSAAEKKKVVKRIQPRTESGDKTNETQQQRNGQVE